jgi:hypothetical protein
MMPGRYRLKGGGVHRQLLDRGAHTSARRHDNLLRVRRKKFGENGYPAFPLCRSLDIVHTFVNAPHTLCRTRVISNEQADVLLSLIRSFQTIA